MTLIPIRRAAGLLCLFASVPLLTVTAPTVAQTAPRPDLSAVQAHLRSLSTFTASFSQSDRKGQELTGMLTIKQPGRIRFQYEPSAGLLIVSDGKSLTMIDYQVSQVQRWPIRNSPLGVLLDPSRDLSRYGRIVQTGDASILTVEVRDPEHPEYGVIQMVFQKRSDAPAGLLLYGWAARDAQGNVTSIRLSNQRYGVPVSDNVFRWRDPRPTGKRGG